MNWYDKYKESKSQKSVIIAMGRGSFLPRKEFEKRLRAIGWDLTEADDGDYMCLAPDGKTKLTVVSAHNWDKNWMKPKQHLLRQNPDLEFLFDPIFIIPNNFNIRTQKLEVEAEQEIPSKSIPFVKLPNPEQITMEILTNNEWKKVLLVDYQDNEILLNDETILNVNPLSNLLVRFP